LIVKQEICWGGEVFQDGLTILLVILGLEQNRKVIIKFLLVRALLKSNPKSPLSSIKIVVIIWVCWLWW